MRQQFSPAQQYQPSRWIGGFLCFLAAGLAATALLAFIYVLFTWFADQGQDFMLLADATSLIRISIIGFIGFFLSYLCALIAILLRQI